MSEFENNGAVRLCGKQCVVNFITWSTRDQVKAKFCFNSSGDRGGGGGILSHGQAVM